MISQEYKEGIKNIPRYCVINFILMYYKLRGYDFWECKNCENNIMNRCNRSRMIGIK